MSINSPKETSCNIVVYNNSGQIVHNMDALILSEGKQNIELDLSNLSNGTYTIIVTSDKSIGYEKVIILK